MDGDPQTITSALSRKGPLGSRVAETSRDTGAPETKASAGTETGTGGHVDSVGCPGGRDAFELYVDVSREQETGHVLGEEVVGPWLSDGTDKPVLAFQWSRRYTGQVIQLEEM